MGLRTRLAKALALPAGATTQTEAQLAVVTPQSGMTAQPLERNPATGTVPFAPGLPLIPALINQPRSDGRADPRKYEFPVAWNLQIVEQRNIPFRLLRDVADSADIVRKCIEVVKSAIIALEWDIAINEDAIARVMAEQGVGSTFASKIVRESYTEQITAAKDFWRSPDRSNGMSFQEWIGVLLEEVLVIDALSIYPNRMLDNKGLHSLEILDGATIKPLLDPRGGRPLPPHPAFQQILWGFPRSEFTASPDADGEFTADDLIYAPRTRRTNTPYGFSPVERCLPLVDLYMKRLHWFRTEFTDGTIPDMMLKSDMEFGNNPELLRGYERVFNDELAGNLEARRRMRLLPNGFDPVFPPNAEAKFSPAFDEWLVKSITGHFGVLPSQIGFTPNAGLGGAGHQQGEANSAETLGLRPIVMWISDLLNQLSHRFLGMPRDLSFVFTAGTEDDEMAQATRRQAELFSGQKTWNEVRSEMGLPLFSFPEADAPLIVGGMGPVPLSATFESVAVDAALQDNDDTDATLGENEQQGETEAEEVERAETEQPTPVDLDESAKAELATFIRWARTEKSRPFTFVALPIQKSLLLNALVAEDAHAARDLAGAWKAGGARPKASPREAFPPNHPARAVSDRLVEVYTERFSSVGSVDSEGIAAAWKVAGTTDGLTWARENIPPVFGDDAQQLLDDLYIESAWMGTVAGRTLVMQAKQRRKAVNLVPDWSNWKPGDADAAARLLGSGKGDGLRALLKESGVTIKGMSDTRIDRIGRALALGADSGATLSDTKQIIDAIVNDPMRSEMIAHTEMTRSTNAAQMDVYKASGVSQVEWQTADFNACEVCAALADGSPYALGSVAEPPAHPWCGCMLLAVDFDTEDDWQYTPEEEAEMDAMGAKAAAPDLVKVRRRAIDDALTLLAEMPDAEPGLIAAPWRVSARPGIPTESWADSKLQLLPIESMTATQRFLKRATIEWQLNNLGHVSDGHNANPNVVLSPDSALIYDGHHRLAAQWLLGVVAMNCWTLEV